MPLPDLAKATALLRSHHAEEAAANFPRVRRVPNSYAVRMLDYYDSLASTGREAFLDALARQSALCFVHPRIVMQRFSDFQSDPALRAFAEANNSARFSMGMRYWGLPLLKPMLTDPMSIEMRQKTRATLDFVPRDDMPPELLPNFDVNALVTAKAPLLRKLIDPSFKKLFAPVKTKLPGGDYKYEGTLEGAPVKISLGFPGRGIQMRYEISITGDPDGVFVFNLPWERLWGVAGHWDFLTEQNAPPSIDLLGELITGVVRLRNQIAALA